MATHRFIIIIYILMLTFLAGCWNPFSNPFSNPFDFGGGDDERPSAQPNRITEPTQKFSLAVGGVAPGRDELVLYDDYGNIRNFIGDPLVCTADDEDMIRLVVRPGYETVSEGSGVRIIALLPGVTAITCVIGDIDLDDIYEVTIPPQSLIQILVAEAATQLVDEAELDDDYEDDDVVSLTSSSPTGDAIGSVIRNRIEIINSEDDTSLFVADDSKYDEDPPASYYREVIFAANQFSPTNPEDPTYDILLDANDRDYLRGDELIAYDQAVITAAGVFNGDIADTTGWAFAFRSPTADEWELIGAAWNSGATELPEGVGFTDASFPALAPIQILIQPDVWTYDDGRPSFIFAREKESNEFAITNTP